MRSAGSGLGWPQPKPTVSWLPGTMKSGAPNPLKVRPMPPKVRSRSGRFRTVGLPLRMSPVQK